MIQGKQASCIDQLQAAPFSLSGKGVLIGVVDSGIDYAHPVFIGADGTTRILEIWDQSIPKESNPPPAGYHIGALYTSQDINNALKLSNPSERYRVVSSNDISGHGTHVAGIAAGNFSTNKYNSLGIATDSKIIAVKLGNPPPNTFPRTSELMQAINYIAEKARELNMPVVINLSFGNNYGSHDGTSLLETYIDAVASYGRISIVISAGNQGYSSTHASGILSRGQVRTVQFNVSEYEFTVNIQIWKSFVDDFDIEIIAPNGTTIGRIGSRPGTSRIRYRNTIILAYYGVPKPFSIFQEIFLDFIPTDTFIDQGVWSIQLIPRRIVRGNYNMWLPSDNVININTKFLEPNPFITISVPATARKAISVGGYNSRTNAFAEFSGRGFTRMTNQVKPDLAAPAVNILSAEPGGGTSLRSGTSMAAPFVTGSVALMMEWGIINGNDPFLYGEKAKAYLMNGARHLQSFRQYPNPMIGYGVLCLNNSIPT